MEIAKVVNIARWTVLFCKSWMVHIRPIWIILGPFNGPEKAHLAILTESYSFVLFISRGTQIAVRVVVLDLMQLTGQIELTKWTGKMMDGNECHLILRMMKSAWSHRPMDRLGWPWQRSSIAVCVALIFFTVLPTQVWMWWWWIDENELINTRYRRERRLKSPSLSLRVAIIVVFFPLKTQTKCWIFVSFLLEYFYLQDIL